MADDKQQRIDFLESQVQRLLNEKAELDARHRQEAADVRGQKAEAIAERDAWKARFEAGRNGGDAREVEGLRLRLREVQAEVKLKEAIWDQRERLAHQTAEALAHRHSEDVRLAEVQRKMAQQKDKSTQERESAFEGELQSLRSTNRELQRIADQRGRTNSGKEIQSLAAQVNDLRQKLYVSETRITGMGAEVSRLNALVRSYELQHAEAVRQLNEISADWELKSRALDEQRQAAEKARSELLAARGEKQLLERSLADSRSSAAKQADRRKEEGRSMKQQAARIIAQEATIARLSTLVANLSGKAVEPDVASLPSTGQSKRARSTSVADVSSARISPTSPPPLPVPSQTPNKRPATRDSDDEDEDEDGEPYVFGRRIKRSVSGLSRQSTSTTSSAMDTSTVDGSPKANSRDSTPQPRSPPKMATSRPEAPATAPPSSTRKRPTSSADGTLKSEVSPTNTSTASLRMEDLELSDDEIVITGERIIAPIKPLPSRSRVPVKETPPFPMKFSASQRRTS